MFARIRITSVKPFRGKHLVEALLEYETGFWIWKTRHSDTLKLLTADGVQWHHSPDTGGRRVALALEEALYDALEQHRLPPR